MAKPNGLDVLSQFIQASWRGAPFYTTEFETAWGYDLAQHKVYRKPVSNVEDTGRNSREFSFDSPFRNGIIPGPSEKDMQTVVAYPDLFNQFIDAFNIGGPGQLVHPHFGKVNCKASTIRVVGRATERDGLTVHVTFVESDDTPEGNAPPADSPAPVTGIAHNASDLDAKLAALDPPLTDSEGMPFTSFSQFGELLRAPFDSFTLLTTRVGNVINAFSNELDKLQESIDRANDVGYWPIADAVSKLRDSLTDMMMAGQKEALKTYRYIVPRDMTLDQIIMQTGVDFDTLVKANPLIVDEPIVREGTIVIYQK